jgi:3-oxoacyl-[acyl-carrier protein] reductase
MNAIDLKNRSAIVTGGARGIGFAIAKRVLASGAAMLLWDADAAALDKAAAALKSAGRVHTARVDVTDDAAIARAVEAAIRDFGKIDILVNNAGITGGNAPLWELTPEVWRRVVEVNLVAPYLASSAAQSCRIWRRPVTAASSISLPLPARKAIPTPRTIRRRKPA